MTATQHGRPRTASTRRAPDDPDRILAALRACRRFHAVSDAALRGAAVSSTLITLASGGEVFRSGGPGRAMFVVETGLITSRLRSVGGHVVDVGFAGPGELFGYFEVFDGGPRDSDAVAVEPSTVVSVPHPFGLGLLTGDPGTLRHVVDDLLGIVRQQNHATIDRGFQTVRVRLAGLLLDLADPRGRIGLDGPQTLLAQRLGTARQTLSRALHGLGADGLIAIGPGGRTITVLDRPRLVAVADRALGDRAAPEVVEHRRG